jgi:hypothetical protein
LKRITRPANEADSSGIRNRGFSVTDVQIVGHPVIRLESHPRGGKSKPAGRWGGLGAGAAGIHGRARKAGSNKGHSGQRPGRESKKKSKK